MEFPYEVIPADPHWDLYKEIDTWLEEHIPESDWRRFLDLSYIDSNMNKTPCGSL